MPSKSKDNWMLYCTRIRISRLTDTVQSFQGLNAWLPNLPHFGFFAEPKHRGHFGSRMQYINVGWILLIIHIDKIHDMTCISAAHNFGLYPHVTSEHSERIMVKPAAGKPREEVSEDPHKLYMRLRHGETKSLWVER